MNKSLFAERLAKMRKQAGYKTQSEFAKAYNEKYPPKRRDDSNGCETSGILGTIKKYENPNYTLSMPTIEKVSNMCDLLGCDPDYLLGRLDVQTHDLDFVCKYTGLSAKAVEHLHSKYEENGWVFDEQSKAFISQLILEYNGKYHDLYSYISAANDSRAIAVQSESGGNVDTGKDNSLKALGVLTKSAPAAPGVVIFGARQAVDFNLSEAARIFREFIAAMVMPDSNASKKKPKKRGKRKEAADDGQ